MGTSNTIMEKIQQVKSLVNKNRTLLITINRSDIILENDEFIEKSQFNYDGLSQYIENSALIDELLDELQDEQSEELAQHIKTHLGSEGAMQKFIRTMEADNFTLIRKAEQTHDKSCRERGINPLNSAFDPEVWLSSEDGLAYDLSKRVLEITGSSLWARKLELQEQRKQDSQRNTFFNRLYSNGLVDKCSNKQIATNNGPS